MIGNRLRFAAPALAALALAGGLAGCQSSGSKDEGQVTQDPAVNLRAGIPPAARQVGQEAESPSYRAEQSGQLYVYDRTANKVVGTVFVRQGQELIVSGPLGRATLDSNEIQIGRILPGRTYLLYFLPTPEAGADAGQPGDLFRITPAQQNRNQ